MVFHRVPSKKRVVKVPLRGIGSDKDITAGQRVPAGGGGGDLDAWTFWLTENPEGFLNPSQGPFPTQFNWNGSNINLRAYVFHDFGAGYFDDSWEIRIELNPIYSNDQPMWTYLINDLTKDFITASADRDWFVALSLNDSGGASGNYSQYCYWWDDGNNLEFSAVTNHAYPDTWYLKWYKLAGENFIHLDYYNDINFTSLITATQTTVGVPQAAWSFRYLVWMENSPTGTPGGNTLQHRQRILMASKTPSAGLTTTTTTTTTT